jgi:crotonobetainyl-CoA:carnitine CoA-transferase CaiB-like acyl-CoA transferase
MGAYFLNINRNKKSVELDLKRPTARAALVRLVETADVFVHNMRLGAAERLGLDYPAVASCNPRISMLRRRALTRTGNTATAPPSTT